MESADVKPKLREKQTELIRLIEAFRGLNKTKEWQTIKELVFDRSLKGIEQQLLSESLSKEVNVSKIYVLQGEWSWSRQFADVPKYVSILENQLADIKNRLNG